MLDERNPVATERALIVGAYDRRDSIDPDLALDELASLVEAAGGVVVGRTLQRLGSERSITAATYIGRGKAQHVASLAEDHEVDVVVFDNELSPAQVRELEKILGKKVIDRSELILDIFASRARTREAKKQVELAQLEYTAPRLRGMWTHLERQAGRGAQGLGTRGPGEKQIEIDRRIVGKRIGKLKGELSAMHARKQREVQARGERGFCIGLVGYTNAGKSTLLNAVTTADTYVADQLFATLDTRTRRWQLPSGPPALLSDTVGFVRRLPHHLVASFRATLAETLGADLLLHVIDASHPEAVEQINAVDGVLGELECDLERVLPVLNKRDVADPVALGALRTRLPNAVAVSAATGEGLDDLRAAVCRRRRECWVQLSVQASAGNGKLLAFARAHAAIVSERFERDVWHAELELPREELPRLRALQKAG